MGKYILAGDDRLDAIIASMQKDISILKRSTRVTASSIDEGNLDVKNGAIRGFHSDGSVGVYFGRFGWTIGGVFTDAGAGISVSTETTLGNKNFFQAYTNTFSSDPSDWVPIIQLGTTMQRANVNADCYRLEVNVQQDPAVFASGTFVVHADGAAVVEGHASAQFYSLNGATYVGGNAGTGVVLRRGTGGVWIEHTTTSAGANCYIETTGTIQRSTSSRRYKQDIEDTKVDRDAVLNMRPRTWRDKQQVEADPDTDKRYIGYIAEELDELGLSQFILYDDEGRPDAISYDRLVVGAIEVIKDLAAQVAELRGMVEKLVDKEKP